MDQPCDKNTGLITRSDTGVRQVSREELALRLRNLAEMNGWTTAQLQREMAELTCGGQETCRGNTTEDYQVGIVIGESTDPRYDDVHFGDLVAYYFPNAICWNASWRLWAQYSGEDTITYLSPQGRMVRAARTRPVYFVEAEAVPFVLARADELMKTKTEKNNENRQAA